MPISEDEFDLRQGQEAQTSTMSKAELRKVRPSTPTDVSN